MRIGELAFYGTKIISLSVPGNVKAVGASVFMGCHKLAVLTLSDGEERIHSFAFCDTGIKRLSIPEAVKVIDSGAFKDCKELTSVTFFK